MFIYKYENYPLRVYASVLLYSEICYKVRGPKSRSDSRLRARCGNFPNKLAWSRSIQPSPPHQMRVGVIG